MKVSRRVDLQALPQPTAGRSNLLVTFSRSSHNPHHLSNLMVGLPLAMTYGHPTYEIERCTEDCIHSLHIHIIVRQRKLNLTGAQLCGCRE